MKGIIFLIISCVIILLAVLLVSKQSMNFGINLLETILWMVIPVAGIYCTLEHIDMGVRIILGLAAAAIVGYLFFYFGLYLCRGIENIVMQGGYIGKNCSINCSVLDKNAMIQEGRNLSGHQTLPFYVPKNSII